MLRGISFLTAVWFSTMVMAADRPNIVWIMAEDISPNLGCYGDPDAITPNLDRLAEESARFTRAFTHAPVCAPSRSGLITGQYPTTMGSHHMRSKLTKRPPLFTDYLQQAGYFVAYPGKTDMNFDLPKGWVDTAQNWTGKKQVLPKDKPFFAYINFTISHESQARANPERHAANTARLKPEQFHDPAKVRLPSYYPDTPLVRKNVAMYHDTVTALDYLVGDVLKYLDDNKLRDNTIVFFFGDHGWGLSRGKRWLYDSGTQVPMLIRWPGKIKPGSVRDDLVCFLDLAPTVLDLAGVKKPDQMVGRVIIGDHTEPAPEFVFSCRDRMDEAYDRIRSVRSPRYRYIRNFHPELPYAQYINYMDEMPIMKEWRRLAFAGKLNKTQMLYWARTKPKEELYDCQTDRENVRNLVDAPEHQAELQRHRAALDKWIVDTKDLGAVPEKELIRQGLVKDLLTTEYAERVKLHPKGSPVP